MCQEYLCEEEMLSTFRSRGEMPWLVRLCQKNWLLYRHKRMAFPLGKSSSSHQKWDSQHFHHHFIFTISITIFIFPPYRLHLQTDVNIRIFPVANSMPPKMRKRGQKSVNATVGQCVEIVSFKHQKAHHL